MNSGLPKFLSLDPRDAWKDLIVTGTDRIEIPNIDWSDKLRIEFQGYKPFCTAYSTTKVLDFLINSDSSQDALALMTNTQPWGNYTNTVFGFVKNNGVVKQSEYGDISLEYWNLIKNYGNKIKYAVSNTIYNKLKKPEKFGWMRINTNSNVLAAELQNGPLIIIFGIGETFNTKKDVVEPYKKVNFWHQSVLAGYDKYKGFLVNDSLRGPRGNGKYYLSRDYPIVSAYQLTANMPENWKEKQKQAQNEEFGFCLQHYGYPRDLTKEQIVAAQMVKAFRKFNNESVWQAAGRFWTVYINAIVYGGYSLEYRNMFGKWMPGDVINDCYHWRRTGRHIFNFNNLR